MFTRVELVYVPCGIYLGNMTNSVGLRAIERERERERERGGERMRNEVVEDRQTYLHNIILYDIIL